MYEKHKLENSNLSVDPYFIRYLYDYFPLAMHSHYSKEILSHPLRKEIINTFIEQDVWSNKFKTFNYLVTKRCNKLIDSVQEFIE